MARYAWASVVFGIAVNAGGCSTNVGSCNLAGPATVNVDASADGLPVDGNYGSAEQCARFCDPARVRCQRLDDRQVRCSNDGVGCQ